jgi:hypothetical protein
VYLARVLVHCHQLNDQVRHGLPGFENNVALAMIEREYWDARTEITVLAQDGIERRGVVSEMPMED